jgi:hypothetical protein
MEKKPKRTSRKTKIKIVLAVAGKFNLSHNVGDVILMESKQAKELIDAKYAIKVK